METDFVSNNMHYFKRYIVSGYLILNYYNYNKINFFEMNIKKIVLTVLAFLFLVSCQTKEEQAISFFKKVINTEFNKYNSSISDFKNSLGKLGIQEFDVIANDSTPSEFSKSLNDYWMLDGLKSNNEYVLEKINAIERNMIIADSISTKIITLNDSLLKYNVNRVSQMVKSIKKALHSL